MNAFYIELKLEFYRLLGLISIEELVLNRHLSEIAASLEKKLIDASSQLKENTI